MCCPTCGEFIEMYEEESDEKGERKKKKIRVPQRVVRRKK